MLHRPPNESNQRSTAGKETAPRKLPAVHQLTQLRRRPPALDDAEDRRPGSSQKLFAALIQSGSSVARTRKEAKSARTIATSENAAARQRPCRRLLTATTRIPRLAANERAAQQPRSASSEATGARAAALLRWTLVGSGPAERTHLQTAQEERSGNT